ncbi:hypothetical protein OAJ98_02210 [Deltaproteobacteria bacterium]|nr:hypothetical protein [Deltaproteobacteria bacterium]
MIKIKVRIHREDLVREVVVDENDTSFFSVPKHIKEHLLEEWNEIEPEVMVSNDYKTIKFSD